jgi:hypothetical protein
VLSILLSVVVGLLAGCGGASIATNGGATEALAASGSDGEAAYTIRVNGSGTASASPDVVDIRLGVETAGDEAEATIDENTEAMNAVLEAVKDFEVTDEDIQTVEYNLWVEDVRNDEGLPTDEARYHLRNVINVRLRDIDQAGTLLEATLSAGANTVGGISFSVADATDLQSEARSAAVENARAKAEELAEAMGVEVGQVRQIQEYSSGPQPRPVERYQEAGLGGGGSVPISGGSFQVQIEIQVVFDIER